MQNAQNAAEIQQRVINLVELYRTKVGKESLVAKEAKSDYDYWEKENEEMAMEAFEAGEFSFISNIFGEGPHTEIWIKTLQVNEQLLGHFYQKVAGEDADPDALSQMLPDFYDCTVFTQEEENFLLSHFREMVNYILLTPNDDLKYVHRYNPMDRFLIPHEVLELIASRFHIEDGNTIYNPFTGFAQFPSLYKNCKFYCEESYEVFNKKWNAFCEAAGMTEKVKNISQLRAWMTISLCANGIDATIIRDGEIPVSYDAMFAYIPQIPNIEENDAFNKNCKANGSSVVSKIISSYQNLKDNGMMALLIPCKQLYDNEERSQHFKAFLKTIVKEHTLAEIIQLPAVMNTHDDFCLVVIKKGQEGNVLLIDARFAGKDPVKDGKTGVLCLDVFFAMLNNSGKECLTGLRKEVFVSFNDLKANLLLPQVYTVEKPSDEEHPVPLSQLCTLVTSKIGKLQYDLPESTPWVNLSNLTTLFTGELDMSTVEKAGCPNNPKYVEGSNEYAFSKSGKFINSIWAQVGTTKGCRVAEYRNCTYLDGNHDAVLLKLTTDGIGTAIVRANGTPVAVGSSISVLIPNKGVDVLSLIALLRLPIIIRQMIAFERVGFDNHLKKILVPSDKRIIGDELCRMKKEESVTNELANELVLAQNKHKAKLENYQHVMRKHIREISSSVRRMKRYINDMDSSEEVKKFLNDRLAVIKTHRLYLSEDIERLNEDNTYGEASPFDIDHNLKNYREYFGSDVCSIKYTNEIANDSIRQYRMEHQDELKELDEKSRKKIMEVALAESSLAYVDIAEYNFGKIVRNILENAKKHGFNDFADVNHKDCVIEIILNWDKERHMYRIDFRNNGNSLPEGLTKESYGENRKYAGKTGGTGIGGYEVAENVRHYNGDYAISQDGDWIVVSIYLPKSKTYGENLQCHLGR